MAIKLSTIKKLFACSHNQCAFPSCNCPIVEENDGDTVSGEICHICAQKPKGPRYDKRLTLEQRDSIDNLILLCQRHHHIVDQNCEKYDVSTLIEYKKRHEGQVFEITKSDAILAKKLYDHCTIVSKNTIINQAHTVNVYSNKTPSVVAHPDALAAHLDERNYVAHLGDRYHEFASQDLSRKKTFEYAVFWRLLAKQFDVKGYTNIPISRFHEVVEYICTKIDRTKLGRINTRKGNKNYSSYEEYLKKTKRSQ